MIRLSGPLGIASVGLLVASLLAGRVDGIPGLAWFGIAVGIPTAIGLLGIARRRSKERIEALGFGTALCGVLPLLAAVHVSDPAWTSVSGTCPTGPSTLFAIRFGWVDCALPGTAIAFGVIAIAVVSALDLGGHGLIPAPTRLIEARSASPAPTRLIEARSASPAPTRLIEARSARGMGVSGLPSPSHPDWWVAVVVAVTAFALVMWVVIMPWAWDSTVVAGLVGAVLWWVFRGSDRVSAVAILILVLLAPSLAGSAVGYALGRRPGDEAGLDDDLDEDREIDDSGVPSADTLLGPGQGVPVEGRVSSEIDDVRRGALGLFGVAGWGVAMLSGAPPLFRMAGDVVFVPDPSNIALISLLATFFPQGSGSVTPTGTLPEGTFVTLTAIWLGVVLAVGWCLYPVLRRMAVEGAVALSVIATAVVSASTPIATVPSLIVAGAVMALRARSMRVGAVLLAGIVLATVTMSGKFVDPSGQPFIPPAIVVLGLLVVAYRFR